MGCAPSRGINPIDAKLVIALQRHKAARGSKELTFNELLLKFPHMALGFQRCRAMFNQLDLNGDRLIDLNEFTSQASRIGLDMSLQDLKDVFESADLDHSTRIDVYEFVLVFVVVHLLNPARAAALPPELLATLEIVEDAFCCFDTSSDGYLEATEVADALCMAGTPGRATHALSKRLFDSLDFDRSGGISFKEFLIGLERMVMEEYGEDADAEAEQVQEENRQLLAAAAAARASGSGGGAKASGATRHGAHTAAAAAGK